MTAKKKPRLALVGTDSLRGKEIKGILSRKKSGAFDVEFFDPEVEEEYSKLTDFKKEPKIIHGTGGDALAGMDLVFLAADKETNRALALRAEELGFRAIDLSETFNDREDIPLVVAGVNDADLKPETSRVVANPHALTIILCRLFHLVGSRAGLSKAVVFVLRPASAFDDAGIQELAGQSVALLNGAPPKKSVFKEQVAFNILSHTETPDAGGFCPSERQVTAEVRRVIGRPSLPLFISIIQAPIFHTYSLMAYLEIEKETDMAAIENLFRKDCSFKLTAFREGCSASPLTVSGKDEIFVGQIKKEESSPRSFGVWLVADNLTLGSALNAFDLAKQMLRAGSA
jgi:aspartate-semialdehyde dehydrogenase